MARALRIAIADDEADVRQYFASALEKLGHHVPIVAANGRELVDRCRADRPDLLITDIRMDEVDGIQAVKLLARDGPIPTILISAHYRPDELGVEVNGQLVTFLTKPVKVEDLAAAVSKVADSFS